MALRATMAKPVAKAPQAHGLKAAVQRVATTAGVSVASLALALAANADVTVKLGADDGALAFVPSKLSVKAGEAITFVNNAGFPHNVVFGDVPKGVDPDAISKDDYLNAPGEMYTVKLTQAGKYTFYCEPHEGAGMKGEVTVE